METAKPRFITNSFHTPRIAVSCCEPGWSPTVMMEDERADACCGVHAHAFGEMHANFYRVREHSNASWIHGCSKRTALRAESASFAT
jgi:hypothetical protein